jgi:hypothetical protein
MIRFATPGTLRYSILRPAASIRDKGRGKARSLFWRRTPSTVRCSTFRPGPLSITRCNTFWPKAPSTIRRKPRPGTLSTARRTMFPKMLRPGTLRTLRSAALSRAGTAMPDKTPDMILRTETSATPSLLPGSNRPRAMPRRTAPKTPGVPRAEVLRLPKLLTSFCTTSRFPMPRFRKLPRPPRHRI